ncbi:MAG: YbaB/EbfC family nucleoid-associated protein [Cyanobacteria bacterium SZAS LIN-2]|nr:YbaB/EbfC family nucleoid-associated protein [Cyanobacteria bacterium SZAS LIN-3]MBS1998523.1 YbaB/EbfC family nucleoid-associated protein [Cyanobacteria bacterium SZAS LIN-2]MBS2006121.1 YbaB/EbfC family nucleoid-associated protein [Cyanobacteria bacterium SZAS TMP-1]
MQPDMNQLMQAVAKAQQDMAKAQQELTTATVEGQAGGGAVRVTCTGDFQFKSIKIKPEAIDAGDPGMLEDLLLTAVNDAANKAKEVGARKMQAIMPPGMGF